MALDLQARMRSATTLGVLAVILLLMLVWGWSAATSPLPGLDTGTTDPGPCSSHQVTAGQKVRRDEVTVSIFNAGTREGLAGSTMEQLVAHGYTAGDTGNAPAGTHVRRAQIWSTTPDDPAVRLVRTAIGPHTRIVDREGLGVGVTVIVGDRFTHVRKGAAYATAEAATTICSPDL